MNEGLLLLLTVLAVAGLAIAVLWYRDLIWPERFAPPVQRQRSRPRLRPRRVVPPEMKAKPREGVSITVSGVPMAQKEVETVSFRTLAKLVHAGVVTETVALETACNVRAGSSKAYQEARANLKKALADLADAGVSRPV